VVRVQRVHINAIACESEALKEAPPLWYAVFFCLFFFVFFCLCFFVVFFVFFGLFFCFVCVFLFVDVELNACVPFYQWKGTPKFGKKLQLKKYKTLCISKLLVKIHKTKTKAIPGGNNCFHLCEREEKMHSIIVVDSLWSS